MKCKSFIRDFIRFAFKKEKWANEPAIVGHCCVINVDIQSGKWTNSFENLMRLNVHWSRHCSASKMRCVLACKVHWSNFVCEQSNEWNKSTSTANNYTENFLLFIKTIRFDSIEMCLNHINDKFLFKFFRKWFHSIIMLSSCKCNRKMYLKYFF